MTPLLEAMSLHKHYAIGGNALGKVFGEAKRQSFLHAVDDVSLSILPGETVGLVGESGCGKSTLVRLLTRLIDPTDGIIRFDGRDIGSIPARNFGRMPLRADIQMVFQDAEGSLNPRYTSFAAIADPIRRLKPGLSTEALRRRVAELAALCGLPPELLHRFPHQLSGGQKARVGIARAIAVEPKLLVLDEPTSALDVSVQVVILHLLQKLKHQLGMSYLFVSHDLHVVQLLCDRVLVMYLGKIVEAGPAAQVFRNPAHPYTKALIEAIPNFEVGSRQGRERLSGEPRSPVDPDPKVCRFYGRCPRGRDHCRDSMPVLQPADTAQAVACHFPEATHALSTV